MKTIAVTKAQTESAIELVKTTFATQLASELDLDKVSAPIAIIDGTGINDDLNGIERPVAFQVKAMNEQRAVVVHSLAKWKRVRLRELDIPEGKGLYTDMRALRPDEDFSPLHSIYVDQWDWEKHIAPADRTIPYLKTTVEKIYAALRNTESVVCAAHTHLSPVLPETITFIHTEELLKAYPSLTPKERENAVAERYGAVFIIGIGGELTDGSIHDGRAPDYDDWSTLTPSGFRGLNGDIVVWNPVLERAFELSSMGIRVDKTALMHQLSARGCSERSALSFHKALLAGELPQSIGGGIGQSRLCMFLLRKKHIGEVQVGIWPDSLRENCLEEGIVLL